MKIEYPDVVIRSQKDIPAGGRCVYVLEVRPGLYKIGCTKNLKTRLRAHVWNEITKFRRADMVRLVAIVNTDDYRRVERKILDSITVFPEGNIDRGEVFRIPGDELIDSIEHSLFYMNRFKNP